VPGSKFGGLGPRYAAFGRRVAKLRIGEPRDPAAKGPSALLQAAIWQDATGKPTSAGNWRW